MDRRKDRKRGSLLRLLTFAYTVERPAAGRHSDSCLNRSAI
nr:MAG TPA: hypothetical protein [Caudoviricetes sp.]